MSKLPKHWKVGGYAFGGAVAASLIVLLIAVSIFGFHLTESVGRFVGVIGTIAGVAGAVLGLLIAMRKTDGIRDKLKDHAA